jgi:hypothetical protein
MTEELFLLLKEEINAEELAQYMSHIQPTTESVLHWSP